MTEILVTGMKGGAGRTTVADSLRYVAGREKIPVEIVDGHGRLNCDLRARMSQADYGIIVEEAGIFGRVDIGVTMGELRRRGIPCGVVINKWDLSEDGEMLRFLEDNQLPLLGRIPFNRYTALILSEGKVLAEEMQDMYQLFFTMLRQIMDSLEVERP